MGHLPDVYNLQRRNPTPDIFRAQPGVVEPNHFANNTKMAARDASGIDGSSPSSSATSTTYPKPRRIMWDELTNVSLINHGSGTSVFSALLGGVAVAVKAPKHGLSAVHVAEVTDELKHESHILARLRHPNIIRFFGCGSVLVGDAHNIFFIVVELLGGGTLSDMTKPTSARPGLNSYCEILDHALSLARALEYLHQAADPTLMTIHRDLKPDNIGFDQAGNLKLFDFGLAAQVPREVEEYSNDEVGTGGGGRRLPRYRLTGQTGSVRYMAPEVALNQPYNEMVDTYSFSMVLWEMLHKRKPFAGMNVDTHRQVVCRDGVRPEIDNSRPRDLTELFTRTWHQDLDHRPNFSSIVQQIEGMLHEASSEKAASATMRPLNGRGGSFRGRLGSMFGSRKKDGASTWF
mmetsp:Transcript_83485/g.235385  ORF Transcript_83485/g.235385 Transcript_83485/m.235385 type:complete len:404 (+) Transcript_83485:222-1433(+)